MAFARRDPAAPPPGVDIPAPVLLAAEDYVKLTFALVGAVALLVVVCVGVYWACVPPRHDDRLVARTVTPDPKKKQT